MVVVLQFQRQFGWGLLVGLMVTICQTEDADVAEMNHPGARGDGLFEPSMLTQQRPLLFTVPDAERSPVPSRRAAVPC